MLTRPSPAASLNPAARAWGTTDGGHRGSPGSQAAYAEWERDTHWYPLSRWYLRPLAKRVARGLARYRIHPNLVSLGGLLLAAVGGACLMSARGLTAESGRILAQLAPAALVLGYWMLDQVDGHLARLKGLSSPYGGWLDANLDELIDVGLHVTAACVLVGQNRNSIPLVLVLGFVVGKYLFMYGLQLGPEQRMERGRGSGQNWGGRGNESGEAVARRPGNEWVRRLYHLPADADVRVHVFVGATVLGALWWELL
ncbi:MAG: CDP-alcohol phosphatidyltransferase family protein, partial [Candidatus Omnitrophica bacterium]|nr:CDP-alcohol phosphatidyltransferase family protein [Candidatus Omnitrophota bacterium]